MKKASITETKNNLSRLIEEVKNGTTIIVFDRNRPVARIEPVTASEGTDSDRIAHLVRQGLVASAKRPLDLQAFLARKKHALPEGTSAVGILESEREQGR